jgi:hypothetical protein
MQSQSQRRAERPVAAEEEWDPKEVHRPDSGPAQYYRAFESHPAQPLRTFRSSPVDGDREACSQGQRSSHRHSRDYGVHGRLQHANFTFVTPVMLPSHAHIRDQALKARILGTELAGEVEAVGKNVCSSRRRPGRGPTGMAGGGHAHTCRPEGEPCIEVESLG